MTRLLMPAVLAASLAGLAGCLSSGEDNRTDEVIERAAFLFGHYLEAQKKQDAQMLSVVRGDLRRLNVEGNALLIRALSSKDQEVQGYAAFALGFSANRAAIAPLVSATHHPDESVRGNAIASLGQLGFTDVPIEPFQRLVKDAVPTVRQATLFGLTSIVSPESDLGMIDVVHESLADPDFQVRTEALIVIRKLKRKESVEPVLAGPLKDVEPQVRAAAAQALGAIGRDAKEATPFLIELLKDEYHRVVEGAWSALNKINDKDLDRSYATWRDWYEDEQRMHYTCLEHKEVSAAVPGTCPRCGKKLERMVRDTSRKPAAAPAPASHPVTGLFVCPDHPEIITTTAAKCGKPGCGKDLIPKNPDPVIYTCPDHPEILTTTPAKCGKPGCGRELIPKK